MSALHSYWEKGPKSKKGLFGEMSGGSGEKREKPRGPIISTRNRPRERVRYRVKNMKPWARHKREASNGHNL